MTSALGRISGLGCFKLVDREFPAVAIAEHAVEDELAHELIPQCPVQPAADQAEAAQVLAEACWSSSLPYAETVARLDEQVRWQLASGCAHCRTAAC